MIDGGELGTTCARVGCMPSKVLVQVAEDFHRRKIFEREGIEGGEALSVDVPEAMEHVQDLRDMFVDRTLGATDNLDETHLLEADRKSTRLNSSHRCISYAVFCLKKKKNNVAEVVVIQRVEAVMGMTGRQARVDGSITWM